ncbi:serine/threonine-protein kinase [Chondromyces crocatus]|uniref:Protein kinase domain-containing protein n=1 Tax=Chondromyces crocatus TaxID=52 RepID=A0A0K1EL61_CHOCO|nr:serine/threonine-protein kinase [Chondromyces crocatus]AKT41417.1 uncharacterized protein CMC5_056170 [Chondromyces crocatus]
MSGNATARLGAWPTPTEPESGAYGSPGSDKTERSPDSPQKVGPARGIPAPGEWIAGRYRVEHVLARGGMGVVVEAEHALLGKRVAVKLLLQDVAADKNALQRFLDEARIAAQLPGDHIARALDFGRTDAGDAYLVMELLVGRDLEAELRRRRRLPLQEAVDYILQACEGVAEAHTLGLVHRDLKPANLFLTRRRDGSALIKVLDFGISKRTLGGAPLTLTNRSAACGTPAYMAPEQMMPVAPVDARCDQHALAVVLFELITGRRVFSADNLGLLAVQILDEPAPRLSVAFPGVPAGLDVAIARALAKSPAERFPDLAGFAQAIAPFGGPGADASARNVAQVLEGAASSRNVVATGPGWNRAGGTNTLPVSSGGKGLRRAVVLSGGRGDVVPTPGGVLAQEAPTPRVRRGQGLQRSSTGAAVVMLVTGALLIALIAGLKSMSAGPTPPSATAATGLARAVRRAGALQKATTTSAARLSTTAVSDDRGSSVLHEEQRQEEQRHENQREESARTATAEARQAARRARVAPPGGTPAHAGLKGQRAAGASFPAPAATSQGHGSTGAESPAARQGTPQSAREVFGDR